MLRGEEEEEEEEKEGVKENERHHVTGRSTWRW